MMMMMTKNIKINNRNFPNKSEMLSSKIKSNQYNMNDVIYLRLFVYTVNVGRTCRKPKNKK